MDTTAENGAAKMKKVPPPPPSIGSSTGETSKPNPPPAPSLAAPKRPGAGPESSASKRQRKELEQSGIPNLTVEQKRLLAQDQGHLKWLFWKPPGMDMSYDALVLGRNVGPVEPDTYVDTTFCRGDILQQLMDIKYEILKVNKEKFFSVRNNMSNFGSLLGKDTFFVNSDFIKMANIDALLDFQLSQPRNSRNENLLGPNELLYFADICGGPGGFAEYMMWKKQWNAKGFGFTSKKSDWNLPQKPHYLKECFDPTYGFWETKGMGDIDSPEEVNWFIRYVRRLTYRQGVHVAVASGGDSSEGDEDKKELRCKYMILAEIMIGLSILREGGHFVIRFYDLFTPFSVGMLFLLYHLFDTITIHKPETALYASAERYVVCKGKKQNRYVREVINYLMECQKFYKNTQRITKGLDQQSAEILEVVPTLLIRNHDYFMRFILSVNERTGREQLEQTRRVLQDIQRGSTPALIRSHHANIKRKATTLWGVPTSFSLGVKYTEASSPEIRAAKLVAPYPPDTFSRIEREGEQELTFQTWDDEVINPQEWHAFLVGRDRGFFLSLGEREVYRFGGAKWSKITDPVELAANTIVYGDIVDEIAILESKQITTTGFQIIDALVLGGKDIRSLPFEERLELCNKFARAMDKPNRSDIAAVRAKTPYELIRIEAILKRATESRLKGGGHGPTKEATYPIDGSTYADEHKTSLVFKPSGALLVKTSKGNAIPGDFLYSMQNRLIWRWNENVRLELIDPDALEDAKTKYGPIHAATLVEFLKPQAPSS